METVDLFYAKLVGYAAGCVMVQKSILNYLTLELQLGTVDSDSFPVYIRCIINNNKKHWFC